MKATTTAAAAAAATRATTEKSTAAIVKICTCIKCWMLILKPPPIDEMRETPTKFYTLMNVERIANYCSRSRFFLSLGPFYLYIYIYFSFRFSMCNGPHIGQYRINRTAKTKTKHYNLFTVWYDTARYVVIRSFCVLRFRAPHVCLCRQFTKIVFFFIWHLNVQKIVKFLHCITWGGSIGETGSCLKLSLIIFVVARVWLECVSCRYVCVRGLLHS